MSAQAVITVDGLGKKYCRTFKRSLWYGLRDVGSELAGSRREDLQLRRNEFWALEDISFTLERGELMGLIGPNGAGKTSLLRLLSGLIKPDRGAITIRGTVRSLIALGAGFNPVLTGRENIFINGAILGFTKKEMDGLLDEILAFSGLEEFLDTPTQNYSSGMLVRLGFSIAVHMRPDIMLVDEVLAVGDAPFRRKARKKMMELLHSGISVLFVSHNISLVSSLTSRCIYLDGGRIQEIGPSETVTASYLTQSLRQHPEGEGGSLMAEAYFTTPHFVMEKVKTGGPGGEEKSEFRTGEDILLRFDVIFRQEIGQVSFGISLRSALDDVAVAFSKSAEPRDFAAGRTSIRCLIRRNFLREGAYVIGFYAADRFGGALFKSHKASAFHIAAEMDTIHSAGSTRGHTVLDADWDVRRERRE